MRKYLFLLPFLLTVITGLSQNLKDSSYTDTNNFIWKGKTENGKMTGRWRSFDTRNKLVRSIVFYENGLKNGEQTNFQENGKLASVFNFSEGKLEGKAIHFTPVKADTLGVIDYVGGQVHGYWILNNWRGELMQKIKWINGIPETSSAYNQLTAISTPPEDYDKYLDVARKYIGLFYENKSLFNQSSTENMGGDSSKRPPPPPSPDSKLAFAESMPQFSGGEGALMNFLQTQIRYPDSVKERGISGTVYIIFTINKDGTISNERIGKGVRGAPELSGEALRVISLMPQWTAGKMNGRNVAVQMQLPIRFMLR